MRYETLKMIHDLLEGVEEAAAEELKSINAEIKKIDPDMLLPEDHPLVKKRREAAERRMKAKKALEDFEARTFEVRQPQ